MCNLIYTNLHNDELNKKLTLFLSSLGATTQKHGFGFVAQGNIASLKTCIPGNLILNAGTHLAKAKGPLFSHIRLASAQVPVTDENAHPFTDGKIFQFHNGTLSPKDDKKFVTRIEKETTSTSGVVSKEYIKISDSKIFFDRLLEIYNEQTGDKNFVKALQDTMKEFTGKFAFMYFIPATHERYIVRGRTADLYISYLKETSEEASRVLGYAIDTSKEVLESSCILLSNLHQIETGSKLFFTAPEEIEKESIYTADEFGLTKVGEIKEEYAYSGGYTGGRNAAYSSWEDDDTNFTVAGTSTTASRVNVINYTPSVVEKYLENVFAFMTDFSISVKEIQIMFYIMYGFSLLEADEVVMKHFCAKVLETLRKTQQKKVRKEIKKLCSGLGKGVPLSIYFKHQFPWMINPSTEQEQILQEIIASRKVN